MSMAVEKWITVEMLASPGRGPVQRDDAHVIGHALRCVFLVGRTADSAPEVPCESGPVRTVISTEVLQIRGLPRGSERSQIRGLVMATVNLGSGRPTLTGEVQRRLI